MAVTFSGKPPIVAVPTPHSAPPAPKPEVIKSVLHARLAQNGESSASDAINDSEIQIVGDLVQVQTQLSKTMLPVVMNAAAISLMKETLKEYGASDLRLTLLHAKSKNAVAPPLLDSVNASFSKLSGTAARLNSVSDLLCAQVEKIDAALKRLNLGVRAWVVIRDEQDEEGNWEKEELGYTKIGSRWCLTLKAATGNLSEGTDERQYWSFSDAPRQLRVRAVDHIPTLIERLCTEADKFVQELEPKVRDLTVITEALNSVGAQS